MQAAEVAVRRPKKGAVAAAVRTRGSGPAEEAAPPLAATGAAQTAVASFQDQLLVCEHDPVYTAGRRIKLAEEEARLRALGADFYYAKRGGEITFHGPGQLVGYPIVDLRRLGKGPRWYIEMVEESIIDTCREWGVETARTEHTGVWAGDRKIAAIGVQVSQGVAWHGFAINCDIDLSWFDHIVPCGIADKGVTSLSEEMGSPVTVEEVTPVITRNLRSRLGYL